MRYERTVWRLLTDTVAAVAKFCAAFALFGIMLMMVCDVVGRYVLNYPVPGAAEVIQIAMGVVVFSALPMVTVPGGHVTLDYFDRPFSGKAGRIMPAVIDAAIIAFLAWRIAVKEMTHLRYAVGQRASMGSGR